MKHFTMWKKRIALNTIATELVDRRVYEKFWTKWRHQLIRKRVSQMMMKHEEKKQLSEVFMAWYQLTLVNRRLLKEWQIYKTKKSVQVVDAEVQRILIQVQSKKRKL